MNVERVTVNGKKMFRVQTEESTCQPSELPRCCFHQGICKHPRGGNGNVAGDFQTGCLHHIFLGLEHAQTLIAYRLTK